MNGILGFILIVIGTFLFFVEFMENNAETIFPKYLYLGGVIVTLGLCFIAMAFIN